MLDKELIEKKLVEFEESAKQVKATRKGLKALEPLEEEIDKLIKDYLKDVKDDSGFEFVAEANHRIIEAKRSLYN